MPNQHQAVTPELHRRIWELGQQAPRLSNGKIGELVGIRDRGTVRKYRDLAPDQGAVSAPLSAPKAAQPSEERTDDIRKDSWTITMPRTRIHTLDELLDFCEVDRQVWEVDRFVCNKWEMGYKDHAQHAQVEPLYQIKAWLKKKAVIETILKEIADLKAQAAQYAPHFPTIIRVRSSYGSNTWVEHALYDHHVGAQIWGVETGGADYDLDTAKRCWTRALGTLMERTDQYKPEGAVFVIGNDMHNADNEAGTTKNGTPQSMAGRYHQMYEVTKQSTIWAIDQQVARYGRVHVVVVGGNHDYLTAWHLGDYLSAWYSNSRNVTIDNGPTKLKWWEKGINMLMFTHGDKGKLENYGKIMAARNPEMWGRTQYREAHTGHVHFKQALEQPGCTVRSLSSLRPACAWTAENMYESMRAAESYVWSGSEGLIGTAGFCVLPDQNLAQP